MKLLFSVPTGYHLRELLLPLQRLLAADSEIDRVFVITPAASLASHIFPSFSAKFEFFTNPTTTEAHVALLKQLQPDAVVTDTVGNDPLDYPILAAAAAAGIPTVTFIASWDNVWKIERMISTKPVHASDCVIVWNEMMRSHMLRILPLLTPERLVVIGAPRLDYFSHTDKIPSKQALYKYLGFSDINRPLIHFSTTELYPMDYIVEAVSTELRDSCYLYASVHPGGDISKHKNLEKFGATVRYSFGRQEKPLHPAFSYLPTEKDIYMLVALFKHTAVLVNHSSSTALESLLAGTPVVNVKYGRPGDWWGWLRSNVRRDFREHYRDVLQDNPTYVVSSKRALVAAVRKSIDNPKAKSAAWSSTVRRMITTVDGTAGRQVLTAIKKHARKG